MPNEAFDTISQAPLPEIVEQLGVAIAAAQHEMDRSSVEIARLMSSTDDGHGVTLPEEKEPRSLLELGFTPTFYQITDATVEAKVSLTIGQTTEWSLGVSIGGMYKMFTASVDASYSSKYSYDVTASSSIKAHFVAIPPPAALSRLILREPADEGDDEG